jgi:hypothetical protein
LIALRTGQRRETRHQIASRTHTLGVHRAVRQLPHVEQTSRSRIEHGRFAALPSQPSRRDRARSGWHPGHQTMSRTPARSGGPKRHRRAGRNFRYGQFRIYPATPIRSLSSAVDQCGANVTTTPVAVRTASHPRPHRPCAARAPGREARRRRKGVRQVSASQRIPSG